MWKDYFIEKSRKISPFLSINTFKVRRIESKANSFLGQEWKEYMRHGSSFSSEFTVCENVCQMTIMYAKFIKYINIIVSIRNIIHTSEDFLSFNIAHMEKRLKVKVSGKRVIRKFDYTI